MTSKEYWQKRETEHAKKNKMSEQTYAEEIRKTYAYMADQIQKEIDGFYAKYANAEKISLAEAKRRVSKLDIEEYGRKAAKYVKEKDFSDQANEEMRLYNATMKINRLELLKANIGLEMVSGFDELQKYFDKTLTQQTIEEFRRQAGILGNSVQENGKMARAIVDASFHNATYSDRIWMYQDMLKAELDKLLKTGLIQGKNPREFVVLSENERKYYGENIPEKIGPNIYGGAEARLEYIGFWKEKFDKLQQMMSNIGDYEATSEATKDLKIIGQIYRKDMGEFLQFLSDENGKNFQKLYENDFKELIEWIYPDYCLNIFDMCHRFDILLKNAIERLHNVTRTDYNQIALGVKTDSHQTGLMVFADDIVLYKQRYRLVAMDGLMAKSYVTGNNILIDDVKKEKDYYCAVFQTRSELVLPIKYGGKIIGVFNSESEETNYYTKEMVEQLYKILENFSSRIIELGYVGNMNHGDIPYVHI